MQETISEQERQVKENRYIEGLLAAIAEVAKYSGELAHDLAGAWNRH